MTKIRQFIVLILILCLAMLLHSCGQMTTEDDGLDSKSIEEASGSTGITTDDTTTDNSTESVKFVAVGVSGKIFTSSDGTTWTERTSGTTGDLYGVAYGNGLFVAVNTGGTLHTSNDGITWNTITGAPDTHRAITFGDDLFVTAGNSYIYTSSDGSSWNLRYTQTSMNFLRAVNYGSIGTVKYQAVGDSGTILTSSDGTTWTSRTSGTSGSIHAIVFGQLFWATGGTAGGMLYSSDAISWHSRTTVTSNSLNGLAYDGNSTTVAVGDAGTILTNHLGLSWTSRSSGTSNILYDVKYGNNIFVAVGDSGTIITSSDGTSWNIQTSGTSYSLRGIVCSE